LTVRDIKNGALAGLLTGLIIRVLAVFLSFIGLAILGRYFDINDVLSGTLPGLNVVGPISVSFFTLLLSLVIIGTILGIVYGALYELIPTANAISKGVIFMLAIWAILWLLIPLILGSGITGARATGVNFTNIVPSFIAAIIWGAILGATFTWVTRRSRAPTRPIVYGRHR
jgi:hypothetical protein